MDSPIHTNYIKEVLFIPGNSTPKFAGIIKKYMFLIGKISDIKSVMNLIRRNPDSAYIELTNLYCNNKQTGITADLETNPITIFSAM